MIRLRKIIAITTALTMSLGLFPIGSSAESLTYAVPPDSIVLADTSHSAPVYIDGNSADFDGIKLIADAFANDIKLITGNQPAVNVIDQISEVQNSPTVIIAGTLNDPIIGELGLDWDINPSGDDSNSDEWERYQIKVIENENQTQIVIAGSDKRGAIYGLFHISQDLGGVSPWVYWGDVVTETKSVLAFTKSELETVSKTPSVKYRGIFLNDEAPSLSGFVSNRFGNYNYLFYANVSELILRLKANYLWPAMWGNSFSDDGILGISNAKDLSNQNKLPLNERDKLANVRITDDYGVVVGFSHHEPMMRSGVEWQRVQGGTPDYNKPTLQGAAKNEWNYFLNRDNIYDFWKDGYNRNKDYDNLVTLGMRGEGDSKLTNPDGTNFTLAQNIELLKNAITDQKEILSDAGHQNVQQTLVLYKEVEEYWYGNASTTGLNKMEELQNDIIVLCEDNNGYTRTLPQENERDRRWGMYYHFDYNGGPKTYMWINVTPLQRIWDNMTMAYDYSVRDLWIVNVGDLKPMELPISYFTDLAYDFETYGTSNPNSADDYTKKWIEQQFPSMTQTQIEKTLKLLNGYADMNARRKAEHIDSSTFNQVNHNETQVELKKAIELSNLANEMWSEFKNTEYSDSFYQLVYYPAEATATVNKVWMTMNLNLLYHGRGSLYANVLADEVLKLLEYDDSLMNYYNNTMSGGYWKNMMSQQHYNYVAWNHESGVRPIPSYVIPDGDNELIVDVQETISAVRNGSLSLPDFENTELQKYAVNFTSSNGGTTEYSVSKDKDWIVTEIGTGTFTSLKTLAVSVDWSVLGNQSDNGVITITSGTQTITVNIRAKFIDTAELPNMTFTPSNGILAMDSNHYSDKKSANNASWEEIENYGKTGTTMKVFPTTSNFTTPDEAPYIEYKINITEAGSYTLTTYFGPSNNVYYSPITMRYGVQIDDENISTVESLPNNYIAGDSNSWSQSVLNAGRIKTTTHNFTAGVHTVRIYGIDAGLLLQKLVLSKTALKPSFSGPSETYYKGKTVIQKPLTWYGIDNVIVLPGDFNGSDCLNNDAVTEGNVLKAVSGKTYNYKVTVPENLTNMIFSVTGKSSVGAIVTLKMGGNTVAELPLTSEEEKIAIEEYIEIQKGPQTLTLEVSGEADITSIGAEFVYTGVMLTNFALAANGGKIQASPGAEGNTAAVIDGSTNHPGVEATGQNPVRIRWSTGEARWVEITLKEAKNIHNVNVVSQMKNTDSGNPTVNTITDLGLKNIQVSYWNGTNWIKYAEGASNNNLVIQQFPLNQPVSTDKIRIDFPINSGNMGWVRLVEVEIWGADEIEEPEEPEEPKEPEPIKVDSVSLNQNAVSIEVGGATQLNAVISPSNADNKAVTWSSDNSGIAAVSSTGMVTGIAPGTAVITVKTSDGNKTASCTITVTSPNTGGGDVNTGGGGGIIGGGGSGNNNQGTQTQSDGTVVKSTTVNSTNSAGESVKTVTDTYTLKNSKNTITVMTETIGGTNRIDASISIKNVSASISTSGVSKINSNISAEVNKLNSILGKNLSKANITMTFDDNTLLKRLNNDKIKRVELNVKGVSGSDKILINRAVVNRSRVLKKEIRVTVSDEKNSVIAAWSIKPGATVTQAMDLNVSLSAANRNNVIKAAAQKTNKTINGLAISFGDGIPKSSRSIINVSFAAKTGQKLYLYKLNERTGEFVKTSQNIVTVNSKGLIIINNVESGVYVLSAKSI